MASPTFIMMAQGILLSRGGYSFAGLSNHS